MNTRPVHVSELSPRGRGGLCVLSVRGGAARERVARLAGRPLPEYGGPCFVRLCIAGELLDEALCLVRAPDWLELHVHGSPVLVERVLRQIETGEVPEADTGSSAPAGAACVEDRARGLLAGVAGEGAARILLDQCEGALRRELSRLCLVEPARWRAGLEMLLERARVADHALRPRRIVLAGPANAGKSTLFNLLLGRERALVSERGGTTRDALSEPARLGAWPVELTDTAGLGSPDRAGLEGELEQQAQALARERAGEADLVLWCQPDPGAVDPRTSHARVLRLTTRADELRPSVLARAPHPVSALHSPESARERIGAWFRESSRLPPEPWEPGEGVPFETPLCAVLARLGGIGSVCQRRAALAPLLGSARVIEGRAAFD